MKTCAIVGINWGDEGKGRMVDLLTEDFDVVIRYQGGGNAGHTVVNDYGKFALHLLPSGVFHPGVVNILGNGVALDAENLWIEIESLREKGVAISPENLKISDRASLLLPWHRELDALEEARLADKQYGSTKQGIAPFYSDKYQKKTVLAGELNDPEELREHLRELLEWKNLILTGVYGAKPYTMEELTAWVENYGGKIRPFLCDTGAYLRSAADAGKRLLFEAQLGALRDLDYGIYPYTTSSNAIAAYAPVGSGLPSARLDAVVGVVRGGLPSARGRGRIRRKDRAAAPRGAHRSRGYALRRAGAGGDGPCADQARCVKLSAGDPRLCAVRAGRGPYRQLSVPDGSEAGKAGA